VQHWSAYYRQLDYWDRTASAGLARKARRQRDPAAVRVQDLLELKVIKQLLDGGVNLRQARRAIECSPRIGRRRPHHANLVIVGEGSVLMRTGEPDHRPLARGQGVFNVVPLRSGR